MVFGKKPVVKIEEKVEPKVIEQDEESAYQVVDVAETVRPVVRNVQTDEVIDLIHSQALILNKLDEVLRLLKG